ncbi:hypothetical protein RYX36_008779 [Vicia faba]
MLLWLFQNWINDLAGKTLVTFQRSLMLIGLPAKIIKQLPSINKGRKALSAYNMRVPRKCNERCYINRILPVLVKKRVVQLNKFDYRLANSLGTEYQKLKCRVNYQALRFTDPIQEMVGKLVKQMRMRKKHYIALHLRFEPDMLAFSGCDYGRRRKEFHN